MDKRALIVLAEGFEEIEAIIPIDVLRRASVDVTTSCLGVKSVTGAHGIEIWADTALEDYEYLPDVVIFPGGIPGAENLARSAEVKKMIKRVSSEKRLIAAICAAPALVLAPTGILNGREATCYPGLEKDFPPEAVYVKKNVVQDGNIITSRGPGTAFLFALKIAENLVGKTKTDMIAEQMLYGG